MKMIGIFSSLLVSVAVHVCIVFAFSFLEEWDQSMASPVQGSAYVRLVYKEHFIEMSAGEKKRRLQKGATAFKVQSPEPIASPNRQEIEPQTETEMPAVAKSSVESDESTPAVNQIFESQESGDSNHGAEMVFAPCRAISLPERWLQMPGFLPRRYEMRFYFTSTTEGELFKVLKMEPAGQQFPHADKLIGSLFENCINRMGSEKVVALQQSIEAFQSIEGQAYSYQLEFDALKTESSSQRGF